MKIQLQEISIRDLVQDYQDLWEDWVFWYSWKLNIRPAYQREFVYKDKQRDAVIDTIRKSFPLNVLYWCKNEDDTYEVLDGQQRIISISQYLSGNFSIDYKYFNNLTDTEQQHILDYKLMVYFCEGTDKEKLDWFKTINISGEKLTDQELRNAVYTWPWLSDVKLKFSKTNCAAYGLAKDYVNWSPIRQELLEKAIAWIHDNEIEDYMSSHQHDLNANELWLYFQNVINWVKTIFPTYRKEMKGIERWKLYNEHHMKHFDTAQFEKDIKMLMEDEDIENKKGIYEYLLTWKERILNIRAFSPNMRREAYERQHGICVLCNEHFEIEKMEADHITPWVEWWKTNSENLQMLCKECNRRKSHK